MDDTECDEKISREAFDIDRKVVEPAAKRSQGGWLVDCCRDVRGPRAKLKMFASNLIAAAEALEGAARSLREHASSVLARADTYTDDRRK